MSGCATLDYARHYGLTVDHRTPLSVDKLLTALVRQYADSDRLEPEIAQYSLEEELSSIVTRHDDILQDEELSLTAVETELLVSATTKPSNLSTISTRTWYDLLPKPHKIRNLKLPEPLMITGVHDIHNVRHTRIYQDLFVFFQQLGPDEDNSEMYSQTKDVSEQGGILHEFDQAAVDLHQQINRERLQLSRKAFLMVADIVKHEHGEDVVQSGYIETLEVKRKEWVQYRYETLDAKDFLQQEDDISSVNNTKHSKTSENRASTLYVKEQIFSSSTLQALTDKPFYVTDARVEPSISDVSAQQASEELDKQCLEFYNISSTNFRHCHKGHDRQKIQNGGETEDTSMNSSPTISSQHTIQGRAVGEVVSIDITAANSLSVGTYLQTALRPTEIPMDCADEHLANTTGQAGEHSSDKSLSTTSAPSISSLPVPVLEALTFVPQREQESRYITQQISDHVSLIKEDVAEQHTFKWISLPVTTLNELLMDPVEFDPNYLRKLTSCPEKIVKSAQLLWKEPGLRLLDRDNRDTYDLDMSLWSEGEQYALASTLVPNVLVTTTQTLLKSETALSDISQRNNDSTQSNDRFYGREHSEPMASSDSKIPVLARQPSNLIRRNNTVPMFSATHSLSAFLDLRNSRRQNSHYQTGGEMQKPHDEDFETIPTGPLHDESKKSFQENIAGYGQTAPDTHQLKSMLPDPAKLQTVRTIFVNSALVQLHPILTSHWESKAEGKLAIIYRDRDLSTEDFADIILNPSTCLLLTNMQILMQKPLPGQSKACGHALIRHRLGIVSKRYHKVFVLITCSAATKSACSMAEQRSMASFTGFCASLSTCSTLVQPLWLSHNVLSSFQEIINAWTWSLICEYAFVNQDFPTIAFIQSETVWELFLRRGGLNPMAAQIVLGNLREPSANPGTCDYEETAQDKLLFGVRRFIRMTSKERLDMFAHVLGTKVVEAISIAIDR